MYQGLSFSPSHLKIWITPATPVRHYQRRKDSYGYGTYKQYTTSLAGLPLHFFPLAKVWKMALSEKDRVWSKHQYCSQRFTAYAGVKSWGCVGRTSTSTRLRSQSEIPVWELATKLRNNRRAKAASAHSRWFRWSEPIWRRSNHHRTKTERYSDALMWRTITSASGRTVGRWMSVMSIQPFPACWTKMGCGASVFTICAIPQRPIWTSWGSHLRKSKSGSGTPTSRPPWISIPTSTWAWRKIWRPGSTGYSQSFRS